MPNRLRRERAYGRYPAAVNPAGPGVVEERLDQAVEVVSLGLYVNLEPGLAGGLAGHRADRDHPALGREAAADAPERSCGPSTTR